MKRSERLKELAEELVRGLRKKISEEKLLRDGEITEVSVQVAVKPAPIPISCVVDDYDKDATVVSENAPSEAQSTISNLSASVDSPPRPRSSRQNQSVGFTVYAEDPAAGKFCQRCGAKIKIGDIVYERPGVSLTSKPDTLFYEHIAGGCEDMPTNRGDFAHDAGGGQRVIRSSRNLS